MIRLIQGVPGAGKTYLAMTEIIKLCEYDPFFDEYRVKENTVIISNIVGLKIQHENLDKLIEKEGLDRFFSVEYLEKIRKKYERVVIVIDECQKYFHSKTWNEKVAFAFQYHRHIGIDIILLTQDSRVLPRGLSSLPEFIVKARSRSVNLGFRFVYDFHDSQTFTHLKTTTLKKDQSIFRAYKSFKFDEKEKPKNAILYWGGLTLGGIALVVVAIIYYLHAFDLTPANGASNTEPQRKHLIAKDIIPYGTPSPERNPNDVVYTTPAPYFIYPITGVIDTGGNLVVLFPNGAILDNPDCDVSKVTMEARCYAPLVLNGVTVLPGELQRPDPLAWANSDPYKEYTSLLEENLKKEVNVHDSKAKKNRVVVNYQEGEVSDSDAR